MQKERIERLKALTATFYRYARGLGSQGGGVRGIAERTEQRTRVALEISELFESELAPVLRGEIPLDSTLALELEDVALSVFNHRRGIFYDAGLALEIFSTLYMHYVQAGDTSGSVKCEYWMGRLYRYFCDKDNELQHYKNGAAQFGLLAEFETEEARDFLLCCVCNLSAALVEGSEYEETLAYVDDILPELVALFQRDEGVWAFVNQSEWYLTLTVLYTNYIVSCADLLVSGRAVPKVKLDAAEEMIEKVREYNAWLSKELGLEGVGIALSDIYEVRFLLGTGALSYAEYAECLLRLYDESGSSPMLESRTYFREAVYEYRIRDLAEISSASAAERSEQIKEQLTELFDLCAGEEMCGEETMALANAEYYVRVAGGVKSAGELAEDVMALARRLNPVTAVHCRVVQRIAERIARRAVTACPDRFIGYRGVSSVEDVSARADEVVAACSAMALAHDVGKVGSTVVLQQNSRQLTDLECMCAREHINVGFRIFNASPETRELALAALCHHRGYAPDVGYPVDIPPDARLLEGFFSVIALADAIDAGTDHIGRSSTRRKSLNDILGEMRRLSGVLYDPAMVDLFDDAALVSEVQGDITDFRVSLYVADASGPAEPI